MQLRAWWKLARFLFFLCLDIMMFLEVQAVLLLTMALEVLSEIANLQRKT